MKAQLKILQDKNKSLSEQLKKKSRFTEMLYKEHELAKKKISAELHDEIAQILTAINFDLAIISRQGQLQDKIKNTQNLIEASVKIINQFARELRPTILDDLGLIPALKSYCNEFSLKNNIPVILSPLFGHDNLSELHKTIFFRITQEALANIIKHAKANKITVSLTKVKQNLRLEIYDDGIGFNPDKKKLSGLLAMDERLKLTKGKLKIISSPGKGTKIIAEIKI